MSLTELVLMPGEDYQKICDNLRSALDTDVAITSDMAATMTGALRNEIDKAIKAANTARNNEDALISGPTGSDYYNDRVTKIRSYAFYYADGLDGLMEFPNVTSVGVGAFRSCTNITEVRFPKAKTVGSTAFQFCSSLRFLDIGDVRNIQASTFNSAGVLNEIVLRKADAPATLANTNAFDGTPFASGGTGGKVYVPQALIESYKTATNWSTLYAQDTCEFVPLEGSEYE